MNPQAGGGSGRLKNKVALVTGAASGIGRATAILFSRAGAKVALADIDLANAEAVAAELEGAASDSLVLRLDVTSKSDWDAAVDTVRSEWNQLDVLVNCAGITDDAPIAQLSLEQWRRVFEVNVDGVFLGMAAALKAMGASGRGAIVNVSSTSGLKASPGASAYCASKAALIQLSRVAALECAEAGSRVRVNCVVPGGVKTPMWRKSPIWEEISNTDEWNAADDAVPLRRFAQPREVAEAMLFLASDESSYITGTVLVVDGGATA